jgi:hypothetical protein
MIGNDTRRRRGLLRHKTGSLRHNADGYQHRDESGG